MMNLKTPTEIAAFTQDLFPSVEAFVKVLFERAKFKTALDFGKVLIELKVFETIDQALVLGYIFEFLIDSRAVEETEFSKMVARLLAHSSLSDNPTADFLFSLLSRTEGGISEKHFSDFLSLFKNLFVPKTEREELLDKPQLVSFVFRKKKHQSKVSKIYSELCLLRSVIDRDDGVEMFKGQLIDFFYNSDVFKSQVKSLYLPCRHLCFFIFDRFNGKDVYPLKAVQALRVCSHQGSS